jgi:hypothetical protein
VSVETSVVHDLNEHDWAGLRTDVWLETSDALGQTGHSEAITLVLPERIFNHPVARALNGFRKILVAPSPEDINSVISGLDTLPSPPDHFDHDAVVFLAMRVAPRPADLYRGACQPQAAAPVVVEKRPPYRGR